MDRDRPTSRKWMLAACLACLSCQACDSFGLYVDAGLAKLALEGDVALAPAGAGSGSLANNDTGDSLGLDSFSGSPYVRLQVRHEKTSVTFSTLYYGDSGTGRLAQDFGAIPQGTLVNTEADILDIKSAVHFDLIDRGPVRVSPGIGLNLIDLDIMADSGSAVASIDTTVPMPMLYLQAEVELGAFDAVLDIGAFNAHIIDYDGWVVDMDAMLRWGPLPLVEVFGGYRAILMDGEGEMHGSAYKTDLLLHGWIIGMKLPF